MLDVTGAAAAAGWPQQFSNWCGVATIGLVANYLGSSISQSAILGILNDPNNQSRWSYPAPSSAYWGPYVATDISGDFGTDPRSLAKGMTVATGRLYHVKVDVNGAWDTTVHIVHDMLTARQPISVFVDHGMHSVIVSGVEATGDPLSNPNSITAIHVWDPGGGVNSVGIQSTQHAVVPINTWLSGAIAWSGSSYFKHRPMPRTSTRARRSIPIQRWGHTPIPAAAGNHLWIGHNVYISPLASNETAGLSPDWELNQSGTLIAGLPNDIWPNLPDGYTGSSVPMPTNPPPPPPPVKPPVIAPKKASLPPPRPTPTPRATATATALPTAAPTATAAPVTPTATSQPAAVCSPIPCAIAIVQRDSALQAGTWLLLLLLVMWLSAAIVVRGRLLRGRKATMEKEEILAGLTAGDVATLGDLATADDVASDLQEKPPAGLLATVPDEAERASPLVAPMQPSPNDVSGMPETIHEAAPGGLAVTADTADTAGEAPTDAHEAPSTLDIPVD